MGRDPIRVNSLAKDSFKPFPDGLKRTHPVKSKMELMKNSTELGTDKPYYQTAAMFHFAEPKEQKLPMMPNFKNAN